MELTNKQIAETADWLISYHMRSFRSRRHGLLPDVEIWPEIVSELDNLRVRLNNDYTPEEIAWKSIGLHETMSRNKAKLKELKEEAHKADDAKPYLEQAEKAMKEMDAAVYLLELLNG